MAKRYVDTTFTSSSKGECEDEWHKQVKMIQELSLTKRFRIRMVKHNQVGFQPASYELQVWEV